MVLGGGSILGDGTWVNFQRRATDLEAVLEGGEELAQFRKPSNDLGGELGLARECCGQGWGDGRHPSGVYRSG